MFTFTQALEEQLKLNKITRIAWEQKDMFLFLIPGSEIKINIQFLFAYGKENSTETYVDYFIRKLGDNIWTPWAVCKKDIEATDWIIVL